MNYVEFQFKGSVYKLMMHSLKTNKLMVRSEEQSVFDLCILGIKKCCFCFKEE